MREKRVGLLAFATMCVCAALAGCAVGPSSPDPVEDDGLVRVETALLDELYVSPDVSIAHYQRVMLDPIEIEFRSGWRDQHPDISEKDFEKLRQKLADMLREELVSELARGGYVVAEAPAPDVLRLRASIADAEFAAPEANADKTTQVYSDGKMTLRVRGFDGPSGVLVARAKDHEEDPNTKILKRADRTTAFINAQRMFKEWAQELRSAMDVAKVKAGARKLQE